MDYYYIVLNMYQNEKKKTTLAFGFNECEVKHGCNVSTPQYKILNRLEVGSIPFVL